MWNDLEAMGRNHPLRKTTWRKFSLLAKSSLLADLNSVEFENLRRNMSKQKTTAPNANPNSIKLDERHLTAGLINALNSEMTPSHMMASMTTMSVNSAFTAKKFANVGDDVEVSDYILELQKAGNEVVGGDLGRLEKMLTNQAITLDLMFNRLAMKATSAEYMKNYEGFMRLAFKAQAQSRSTVEALAMLKNPPPYIQTNIGQVGHNQVNYAYATTSEHSCIPMQAEAENLETAPNKLLDKVPV